MIFLVDLSAFGRLPYLTFLSISVAASYLTRHKRHSPFVACCGSAAILHFRRGQARGRPCLEHRPYVHRLLSPHCPHPQTFEMFFVHSLEHRINLHPSFFNAGSEQIIREKLLADVEGTNTGTMMIIAVVTIRDISEPKIVPGTGFAQYDVSYNAVVWRPFRGEVVDGLVSSVVSNGFFVDVAGLNVFVSKSVSRDRVGGMMSCSDVDGDLLR